MRAIKVTAPGELSICEEAAPMLENEDSVLIEVKAAGICGSDISIYKGTSPVATYPRVIGHEFAGVAIKVGKNVTHIKEGDHVTVNPVVPCGTCRVCQKGRSNVCANLEVIGVHRDGGYRQTVCVPAKNAFVVADTVPWEHAAVVEPYTVAAQVASRGGVAAGDTVLILGSGQIALTILEVCKLLGARCIMTDIVSRRLELASQYGADVVVNTSQEDVLQQVLVHTDGIGADVAIDAACVGTTLEQAVQCTRNGGVIVTMGFAPRPVPATELDITKKELDIRGSRLNNNKFPQIISWFEDGSLNPSRIITHTLPFTNVLQGMEQIKEQPETTMKVVLTFDTEKN